ncbi:hypothetical protein [Dactylosporangium salmoneum]|uniref:DUF998 domain-containing protein n=1 Tax=Dactylosporangium salmoneum TaxID=53361 RepID=A0ABN3G4S8_9ACTN
MAHLHTPVRGAFHLTVATAAVAVADLVVTALGRWRFGASLPEFGWVIGADPPYDGIRARFVFVLVVAGLVAAVACLATRLVTRARPGARLAIVSTLPFGILLSLFTIPYGPNNVGEESQGESAAAHAAAEAAFDHVFPLWYTGGHALLVVAYAVLVLRLWIVLRRPDVRDHFEFAGPDEPAAAAPGRIA